MQINGNETENSYANSMLGVPIWSRGIDELVASSLAAMAAPAGGRKNGQPFVFACANPHSLTVAERDPSFKAALHDADAVVADGVGMQIAAGMCGRKLGPRITGIDYFRALMMALQHRGGGRAAFLGSRPQVLELLAARSRAAFPDVVVSAMISPPFGQWSADQNARFIREINDSRPDVLWVGMTAPKQELWVRAHQRELDCAVVGSIGAVFDYFAGTVQRAPQWLCDAGLEWAYRLSREPRRLWSRTLVSAPQFLGLAMSEALRTRIQ